MDFDTAIARLESSGAAIAALTEGIENDQARWRPAVDQWSVLEVVNHLADEEVEDFRQRVDFTLHRPGEPWPLTDPAGWVISRRYNARDIAESRQRFHAARADALAWLRGLDAPDWSLGYDHPRAGVLTAGDLLLSWVAHDLLHLRQLVELHYGWLRVAAPDRRIGYAGDW